MAADWITPDTASGWTNPTYAIDDDLNTKAYKLVQNRQWSSYLTMGLDDAVTASKVRLYAYFCSYMTIVQVDVYRNGGWVNVYDGALWNAWKTIEFAEGTVEQMRIRCFNGNFTYNCRVDVNEVDFWGEVLAVPYSFIM